jgi:rubrerythrin
LFGADQKTETVICSAQKEIPMRLDEQLLRLYMSQLLARPEGRAHVLNQVADAESSGEGEIFNRLLNQVDDPELARMIRRHQADEIRHAEMFRECADRTGVPARPVPAHLKMIDRLSRALGNFMDRPVTDRRGVMEAYLVLQVIEERATSQFGLFEEIFRDYDARTADVFAAVAKDEERHLLYCHAIARCYAPDLATHAETLHHYRAVEAREFAANGQANMIYALEQGFLDVGPVGKLLWQGVAQVTRRLRSEQRTRFWNQPPVQSVAVAA